MYKEELKIIIVEELRAIGIKPAVNGDADITVDEQFMDTKWSTGKKKIEYHNSAYFDEEEKTLYYWESSKETGSGFSFGVESESSFQSGTTLFRKVKSIQYGKDGKVYEYDLDLGQIPKIYKENAKKNGWKFKLVLKKEKARFLVGKAEPTSIYATHTSGGSRYCSNCGNHLEADMKFCVKCGASMEGTENIPAIDPEGRETPVRSQAFHVETAFEKYRKPKKPMKKGCLISLIVAVTVFVLLLILVFLPGDDSGTADANGVANPALGEVTESSKLYVDMGHDFTIFKGGKELYDTANEIYTHDLVLVCSVWQDIDVKVDSADPEGSKVKEIRIVDFRLDNGPVIGKFSGLNGGTIVDPRDSSQMSGRLENGDLVFDMEEISKLYDAYSNTITSNFEIQDIAKYTYPQDYNGSMSFDISYKNAGVKSDDLKFRISYQIKLFTMAGDTYTRNVVLEEYPGDFMMNPDLLYPSTRIFDYNMGQPFIE